MSPYLVVLAVLTALVVVTVIFGIVSSLITLKNHRSGAFYEKFRTNVWAYELMIGVASLFIAVVSLLIGAFVDDPAALWISSVVGATLPVIATVRAFRTVLIQPHGVIRRLGLNRRQDSTLTGPIRAGVPFTRDHYTNLDDHAGDE